MCNIPEDRAELNVVKTVNLHDESFQRVKMQTSHAIRLVKLEVANFNGVLQPHK
jgi:hypothetical protein